MGARQASRWASRARRAVGVAVLGSLAIASSVFAPAAMADTAPTATVGKISYTSHYWPNAVSSSSGMAAAWQNASAYTYGGYCNSGVTPVTVDGLSNHTLCGSNAGIISHVVVPFSTTTAGSWHFQVGPDYGNGSMMLIDGAVVQSHWYDIWFGGNFNNTPRSSTPR